MLTNPFKYAMRVGKVFTGKEVLEDVFIIIEGGKISRISEDWEGTYVDFSDFVATPGYIDPNTLLGVSFHRLGFFHPHSTGKFSCHQVLSIDAYSPYSKDVSLAREFGITSAFISVSNVNPISGFGVAVKTLREERKRVIYEGSWHLKVSLGPRYENGSLKMTSDEVACIVREFFKGHKEELGKGFLKGGVFFYVQEPEDVETAISICEDFGIRGAIVGYCPSNFSKTLKELGMHVIFSPFWGRIPHSSQEYVDFKEVARIIKAGVKVSLSTFHPLLDIRFLQLAPILCVRYGIEPKEAIKTVTVNPAEVLEIKNRVGSISPGLDGDVIIWEDLPFHFSSRIKEIYVRGLRIPRRPEVDEDRG